jgi:hypothetical protein
MRSGEPMDERYRAPKDELAGPTSTIVERRTHLFVTFGVGLLLMAALAILKGEVEIGGETTLAVAIALAAVGVDLFRWRRLRRMRATEDPEAIVAVDGERVRTVARADVVVVQPWHGVTAVLVVVLLAIVRDAGVRPHDIAAAVARPLFIVLFASALWHRFSRRRVRLPGERWGRWFSCDDVKHLLPEDSSSCPPIDPERSQS